MKSTNLFYLFSTFVLIFAVDKNIRKVIGSSDNSSIILDIHGNLSRILTSCQKNYTDIIIVSNTILNTHSKWLSDLHTHFSGKIQIHNLSSFYERMDSFIYSKTHAYICIIQSGEDVLKLLSRMVSAYSDIEVPEFYVVSTFPNSCALADEVFNLLWFRGVLDYYYICPHKNNEVKIYTQNLLTYRIPERWKETTDEYRTKYNMTIHERDGHEENICDNFYLDRRKYLDRSTLIVGLHMKYLPFRKFWISFDNSFAKTHDQYFSIDQFLILDTLRSSFNPRNLFIFHFDPNSAITPEENDFFSALPDVLLFHFKQNAIIADYSTTYPFAKSDRRIITYNRGFKTPVEKIGKFYSVETLLFTVFILGLVFVVIWFKEKTIAFPVFEIIRLLISQTLYTRMRSLPMRIFFGVVFIYFLVVQATFNGNLAKFLTKPELRKHPETWDDLKDVDKNLIYHSLDNANQNDTECLQYILSNDTSTVCISDYLTVVRPVFSQPELYMSRTTLDTIYETHLIYSRKLKERITKHFMLYTDLGFTKYLSLMIEKYSQLYLKKIKMQLQYDFQPINISNLTFNFILLAIGLVMATLSFCVEICYAKKMAR